MIDFLKKFDPSVINGCYSLNIIYMIPLVCLQKVNFLNYQ